VSPVGYELSFYIPEDDILHSHRRENLKPYIVLVVVNALCSVYKLLSLFGISRLVLSRKYSSCLDSDGVAGVGSRNYRFFIPTFHYPRVT
jgi:hypothetical protein